MIHVNSNSISKPRMICRPRLSCIAQRRTEAEVIAITNHVHNVKIISQRIALDLRFPLAADPLLATRDPDHDCSIFPRPLTFPLKLTRWKDRPIKLTRFNLIKVRCQIIRHQLIRMTRITVKRSCAHPHTCTPLLYRAKG